MQNSIALVGFPRLQEQLATQLLGSHDVTVQAVTFEEARGRLDMFNLVLFFWPDCGDTPIYKLMSMRPNSREKGCPILLVASKSGMRAAQRAVGGAAEDVLAAPLQSGELAQKLAKYLKMPENKEKSAADAGVINAIVEATIVSFSKLGGLPCERSGLRLFKEEVARGFYVARLELSGKCTGFVCLAIPQGLAKRVIRNMHGLPEEEIVDETMNEGIGSLLIGVAEAARAELGEGVCDFAQSGVQVFSGGPHTVAQPRGIPVFVIEFLAEGEHFDVLVCLRQKQA